MERRPGNARAKFAGVLAARNESLEAMRRARKTWATFLSVDSRSGFRYYFASLIYHNRGVAQTGSAFGSGPKGQGFKSLHPDHLENQTFQNRLEGLFFSTCSRNTLPSCDTPRRSQSDRSYGHCDSLMKTRQPQCRAPTPSKNKTIRRRPHQKSIARNPARRHRLQRPTWASGLYVSKSKQLRTSV